MSTEVEFNPFRPDGELSREAEDIIRNSTILRDKVIINDPSLKRPENGISGDISHSAENPPKAEPTSPRNGPAQQYESSPIWTGEVVSGQVAPVTQTVAPDETEQPMLQVEHVKIKSGPTKCCLIQ